MEKRTHQGIPKLKNVLSSDTVQAFSDPEAEHELHVDVDATLTQRKLGQQEWQEEQYARRSLTGTERRYSEIGFEALASDFGCRNFQLFLYRKPF